MPRSNRSRHLRPLLTACVLASLAGCAKHGGYTQGHLNAAEEKLALLKSGTQWNMAQQQFLAGDLQKAIKTVDEAIQLNETVPKAHVLRGRILVELAQLEEARKSFLRAIELDPTLSDPHYYLGIIHERFRQVDEALACYLAAVELDKTNAQYVVAAVEMLISADRLDEAQAFIEDRRESFQYNAAIRQAEGHIALLRGDPELASELLGQARLLSPDDANILEELARAQIDAGLFADAEMNVAKLLEMPDHAERRDLLHLHALCLQKVDRPVEAREILVGLTSAKEGAGDIQAWIELGNVCATLRDNIRLRNAAMRVVALAPNRYEGYFLRSLAHWRNGELEAALETVDEAVRLSKEDTGPLLLRALIQQDMGQVAAACETLTIAVQQNPADEEAKHLLASLGGAAVATHPDATN